jgi:glycosyltransferase involved in cell wall biosynthesis
VTIGLPIRNGGALTRRAVESVLGQSYGDLELLVSDNCSTDETPDVCREYARADPRVVYGRTDRNLGAAGNYCRVARLARGEFFRWISHDDWIAPDFVRECLRVAEEDAGIISVAPVMDVVDHRGVKLESISSYVGRARWSEDRLEQYRQMMDELTYCETQGGLFMIAYEYAFHRTSLLRRTRLVLPFISSDYVLAAELALFGRLAFLDAPLGTFTLGTSGAGTTANFMAWNPGAIQRMLCPDRAGRWDVALSVRRRHYEHLVAVLRSPLPAAQKPLALEAATRPMRGRLAKRLRARALAGAHARAGAGPR